ncbi:MAG: hypothetical protein R3E79_00030 [Caldilineaceae bacterium]
MTIATNEPTNQPTNQLPLDDRPHLVLRIVQWLVDTYRPYLGWWVLFVTMTLAALPSLGLGENRVTELRRIQASVDWVGPGAVVVTWLLLGWRQPRRLTRWPLLHLLIVLSLLLLAGLVILSQTLIGWLPGLGQLWTTLLTGSWPALGWQLITDWLGLVTRFSLWWQGVRTGGAAQDNLIFAALAGLLFWCFGVLTAWLLRRRRQGFVAATPLLWLLGTILLYSGVNRSLMLSGVLLAVALHLLLDQQRLTERWQQLRLDYSPDLRWDRLMVVTLIAGGVFLVAGVMPNLYNQALVSRYYAWIAPLDERMEALRGRLFPDLAGISRLRGRGRHRVAQCLSAGRGRYIGAKRGDACAHR